LKEGKFVSGRFISTHSVALVLPMHIAYMPERGGSVHADAASIGGNYGDVTQVHAGAHVVNQHRHRHEVIHRTREKALFLGGVQIHAHQA